ncbi:hypothetical protein [Streptomyces griseomycini]|uniref:Uncharacterized protein n=1 Tax=Streptomyces griseomycini TaxID=66895 RepID=A0A7W7V9Z7_9ACTN|nr:hypothetical protein [Streptomyces griseomycini]MBB4902593.1 hypothetical protein [Streptomyces griseomycini]GGR54353.1 hypothetical protein GCM10015536_69640 [Streptomyces griseomycini]
MQTIALFDFPAALAPVRPRVPLALGEMPVSSVPAAYDRGHLYSPKEGTAERVDHRPGDRFAPLPKAPHEPKAWGTWWRAEANAPTPDYLGLEPGDVITLVDDVTATVVSTCRFGAVVRYEVPPSPWAAETHVDMYVTARNQFGHWYR